MIIDIYNFQKVREGMLGEIEKLQIGEKYPRIKLLILEKLSKSKYRVTDGDKEGFLTFEASNLVVAKKIEVHGTYLFKALRKGTILLLHFHIFILHCKFW